MIGPHFDAVRPIMNPMIVQNLCWSGREEIKKTNLMKTADRLLSGSELRYDMILRVPNFDAFGSPENPLILNLRRTSA